MPIYHELVHHCLCHLVETSLFSFFSASRDMCCIELLKNMVCTDQMKYFNAVEYFDSLYSFCLIIGSPLFNYKLKEPILHSL